MKWSYYILVLLAVLLTVNCSQVNDPDLDAETLWISLLNKDHYAVDTALVIWGNEDQQKFAIAEDSTADTLLLKIPLGNRKMAQMDTVQIVLLGASHKVAWYTLQYDTEGDLVNVAHATVDQRIAKIMLQQASSERSELKMEYVIAQNVLKGDSLFKNYPAWLDSVYAKVSQDQVDSVKALIDSLALRLMLEQELSLTKASKSWLLDLSSEDVISKLDAWLADDVISEEEYQILLPSSSSQSSSSSEPSSSSSVEPSSSSLLPSSSSETETDSARYYRLFSPEAYQDEIVKVQEGETSIALSSEFSESLRISRFEITQAQYASTMGLEAPPAGRAGWPVFVSVYEAMYFCNQRSKAEGLDTLYTYDAMLTSYKDPFSEETVAGIFLENVDVLPDVEGKDGLGNEIYRKGYRLPTETEWDKVYFGSASKTDSLYWGLDTLSAHIAWFANGSSDSEMPVGSKLPNSLGIFDMSGNLAEWVYKTTGDVDLLTSYLVRGGHYNDASWIHLSPYDDPRAIFGITKSGFYGFRVVRVGDD